MEMAVDGTKTSIDAVEAVKLKIKADEKAKKDLEDALDKDVQKLIQIASNLMRNGMCSREGFYGFEVKVSEITYKKDPRMVIDRFCDLIKAEDFIVPKPVYKLAFRPKNVRYLLQFRPSDEAKRQALA